MSIETLLRTLLLGIALFAVGAFLTGYRIRTRLPAKAQANRALTLWALSIVLLLGIGAWALSRLFGSLLLMEMALIGATLLCALGGGLRLGGRQRGQGLLFGLMTLLGLLLLYQKNSQLLHLMQALGLDSHRVAYVPEKNKACSENLKSLYTAFALYAQDWDALPPAANWLDNEELTSKVRQNEWLHCPATGSNRHDETYGYAYNDLVAGRKLGGSALKAQPAAATTPLLYDSARLAKNAHDPATSLPRPGRHGGRNNILYLDGHVEAVTPP